MSWTEEQKAEHRSKRWDREEYKAAKAKARAENREAWRRDRTNANLEVAEAHAAVVPILPPRDEPGSAAHTRVNASSLNKMRAIMADVNAPLYRRLDAAEVVLGYELAPASLVDLPAEQVAATSFRFMRAVADAPETPERLQFRALKAIIAIENSRAAARQSSGQLVAKRELQRQLGRETEWTGGMWPWPPANIAERYNRAKRRL